MPCRSFSPSIYNNNQADHREDEVGVATVLRRVRHKCLVSVRCQHTGTTGMTGNTGRHGTIATLYRARTSFLTVLNSRDGFPGVSRPTKVLG